LNLSINFQQFEPDVIQVETVVIVGLLLITGIALLVRRLRFPYTVALVIAGLLLSVGSALLPFNLGNPSELISSELILALFVPPLVFEGALRIPWKRFQANLAPILLLAVFGVVLGTFVVGAVIVSIADGFHALMTFLSFPATSDMIRIPFTAAIAFGALISATDPVAVIAFFRSLGVDKRLATLVEGESLLNDGTSIVIFKLALALGGVAALNSGELTGYHFTLLSIVWEFAQVALGGLLVGLAVGKLAEIILKNTDNRHIETTVTIPIAFGAYLLAERFELSGILSVMAVGIYLGSVIPANTTPTTRIALYNFWEVLSFIVTSLIFLVIGWIIDIRQFFSLQNLVRVFAAVVAILVARSLVVYGMSALTNYALPWLSRRRYALINSPIPIAYQHAMFWGGMRGAISLALALSLASNAFGPGVGDQLRLMTFGVALFTLLVQGTTIEGLIKRLGLAARSERQRQTERSLGQYYATRAAQEELTRLHNSGVISSSLWRAMEDAQQAELDEHDQAVRDLLLRFPGLSSELALQARRLILNAERTALGEAVSREIISEDIQDELLDELDARIEVLELIDRQEATSLLVDDDDLGVDQP
jgi:CPA1 family monovalent cation:H+ antiporter